MLILFPLLLILGSTITVKAAPSTAEVYANTPAGMDLSTTILDKISNFSGKTSSVTNDAKFIYQGEQNNTTDIMQMTSDISKTQLSSFWGNYDTNYFDLTKNQTVSAWIYMGNAYDKTPDGMAFVLQNDAKKDDAIARNSAGQPTGGETLGVWGANKAPDLTSSTYNLQNGAIQNSFALEFDSLKNGTMGSSSYVHDDYFDGGLDSNGSEFVKGQHLAWNYPGEAIYTANQFRYSFLNLSTGYAYQMDHSKGHVLAPNATVAGYNQDSTVKSSWKHFVFNYKKPATGSTKAHFGYIFNDKYYDGTGKDFNDWDKSREDIEIDISKLNSTNGKVRWGFTAGNGSTKATAQTTAIIIEKMPAIANVEATTGLYDVTQDRTVDDLDKANSVVQTKPTSAYRVGNNDDLRFDYTLNYTSGNSGTGDITTVMNLPKNVDFTKNSDGNIGQIIYSDKTVPITTDNLSADKTSLNLTLTSMDTTNSNVKIQLFGKAISDGSSKDFTIVDKAHTSYRSDYFTDDSMTNKFAINNDSLNITPTGTLSSEVKLGDTVTLPGNITYAKGTQFNDLGLTFQTKIDGKKQDNGILSTTAGMTSVPYELDYLANDLGVGEHTIEILATDSFNRSSNVVTYKITVTDKSKLLLSAEKTDMVIEKSVDSYLQGQITYENGSDLDATKIKYYLSLDDEDYSKNSVTTGSGTKIDLNHKLAANTLTIGNHTAKIYVSDGSQESETITYKIKVIDQGITFIPKDREITVHDNQPVKLTGTYDYLAATDLEHKGTIIVNAKIKNQSDSDFANLSSVTITDEGSISYEVTPIASSQKATETLGEYLARVPDAKGLKVGKNEIQLTLTKDNFHSKTVTYIVNVPDITPKITTEKENISLGGTQSQVSFADTYEYQDDTDYELNSEDLHGVAVVENVGTKAFINAKPTETTKTPTVLNTTLQLKNDLGITSNTGSYKVPMYFTDPYGRKTNTIDYTVSFLDKILELDTDNYEFSDIPYDSKSGDYIQRKNKHWKLAVNSYKSQWTLTAKTNGMFHNTDNEKFNGGMTFVNNGIATALSNNEISIASGNSKDSDTNVVTDIGGNWNSDDGILLKNNGFNLSGGYTGTIEWTLKDTPQ